MPTQTENPSAKIEKGGICETLPSSLTKEQLQKLRHEVEQGQISTDPNEYNLPDTEIAQTDTVASILGKIFSTKGKNAPQGSIDRIELALSAQGLDLKNMDASSFRVESGKLIITSRDGKFVTYDLLPWKVLEGKETEEVLYRHEYALSEHDGATPLTKEPEKIEAGVDATRHAEKAREEKWYAKKVKDAKLLLDTYQANKNRFDAATQQLIQSHMSILADLGAQTSFTSKDIKQNFENKWNKDEVFGPNGVYNLVLAFQRVLDIYDWDDTVKDEKKKLVVALVQGATVRKQSERYVQATAGASNGEDEPGLICTPPTPVTPNAPEETAGQYMRVETKPGSLTPSADQFNESMTPAVASEILIREYKTNGLVAFQAGLISIAEKDPNKAQSVLDTVFETLRSSDKETAMRLMSEITSGKASEVKKQIDASLQEAIEKETNPENKKVLQLMKLLNDIKYNAENPQATQDTLAREKEGGANEMRTILAALGAIDGSKLTGEFKEFYETTKSTISDRLRTSMAADILETSRNSLEGALLDRTKKDTTVVRSLEQLRTMDRGDLANALRNQGAMEWFDSDAEVYLASCHVMEAMRLYLTYLYPQERAKGANIMNPLKWAFEQVQAGAKIELPKNFTALDTDVFEDVLTGNKTKITAGIIEPDKLFVAKDAELRMFDTYQKGEQRIGESSIWNLAPTTAWGGALMGGVTGAGLAASGINDRLHTDKGAFMAHQHGMIAGSEELFAGDVTGFMGQNGDLGPVEILELRKLAHLRETKNYDEARALAARIIVDKMPPVSEAEISKRAMELSKDYDSKIRAQVRLMMENDERFKGLDYTALNAAIDKATKEAIEEKSFLQLVGEGAAKMDGANLSAFEKSALEKLNTMNGNGLIPFSDESMDVVISVSKLVVEIVAIELVTAGAGSFIAGAAGVGAVAEVGATGLAVARSTGAARRAFEAGEALAGSAGTAGRLTRIIARNRRVASGVDWLAGGRTVGSRAARSLVHATAFAEGQHLLHGSSLQVIDDPTGAAWEVGTTALTIWGLGATQRFMRGQLARPGTTELLTPALGRTTGGALREGGIATGIQAPGRVGAAFDATVGRTSARVGEYLAGRPLLRHPAEIGAEMLVLHNLGRMEKWGAVQTGMVSQLQMDAMEDPEAWHEYAQTAGVVMGLRAWGIAQRRKPPTSEAIVRVGPAAIVKAEKPGPIVKGEKPGPIVKGEKPGPIVKGEKPGPIIESGKTETAPATATPLAEIGTSKEVRSALQVRRVVLDGEHISSKEVLDQSRKFLELQETQIRQGNYNKSTLDEVVRRIYDIPPQVELTEANWNSLTIKKVASNIHPDKGGDEAFFKAISTFTTTAKSALIG